MMPPRGKARAQSGSNPRLRFQTGKGYSFSSYFRKTISPRSSTESIIAMIARSEGFPSVIAVCREELPRYETPVFVEVLAEFPLTNTMKVDRRALERRAARRES